MKENPQITVQSRKWNWPRPRRTATCDLNPGTYVCVEISDNGPGIAPDVLPRIFEPFFTTKGGQASRAGARVGLRHRDESRRRRGGFQPTRRGDFRACLFAGGKKIGAGQRASARDNLNGTQTILMVDDEDLMLTMGQTMLSAFGYKVLTANSGQKALEIISKGDRRLIWSSRIW